MLKQSKLRTQRQHNGILLTGMFILLSMVMFLVNYTDSQLMLGISKYVNYLLISYMIVVSLLQAIIWLFRNKAHKGMKYAIYHYFLILKIRKAFLDANYYNKRLYFNNEIADLPKIKLEFSNSFSKAKLFIENININKDIGDVNISFALDNFVVNVSYLSNDENFYIFEIYDSNIDQQYKFTSFSDFRNQSKQIGNYHLFIDKSVSIPLHGTLLVGQTGSGKTYALYSLILQMLTKKVHYHLYFADPKNSSLAVLGDKISKENTVADIEDIIKLLQKFNKLMNQRKVEIKEKLNTKLEGTYADFGYEPHIFIFDEFASFQSVIQTMEKKKRDEVTKLLSQVILQGRQLGFFLWIVMQKSDASLLPTNLRENLPVKFVLGNAEKQTYITAYGSGVDIPEKNYKLGQGVFTCHEIANTPRMCHFSYLNFDILKVVNQLRKGTGVL